MTLID
jgi:hypothetical protein